MISPQQVLVISSDPRSGERLIQVLKRWDITASSERPETLTDSALGVSGVGLVVVATQGLDPGSLQTVVSLARGRQLPILGILRSETNLRDAVADSAPFDDWVSASTGGEELAARILALQARAGRRSVIDPRFLALTVHDLRTPLNVIGLTIRAISQSTPTKTPEFEEDLQFLQENARQIERMLAQLGDYCRLLENESPSHGVEFDLCRFLEDFVEDRAGRVGASAPPVVLDPGPTRPREVSLDPNRTRTALHHAVANATAASGTTPIRVALVGNNDRVRIEITVDRPPPSTVVSTPLRPHLFERLTGSAAERRGLDLAIAARISESFGGSACLEVDPGRRSTIVLDWPARLAPSP